MGNLLNWQIAGITIIAGKLEAIHAIASGLGSLGLELSEAESSSVAPTAVNFASRNSWYISSDIKVSGHFDQSVESRMSEAGTFCCYY